MRLTILGQSGSGKSTLARALFLRYLKNNARDRYYVLDIYPTHYVGNDVLPGLDRFGFSKVPINPDVLDKLGSTPGDYEQKIELYDWLSMVSKVPKAVFIIELPPELRAATANKISEAIRRLGNAVVLVDEAGSFISNVQRKIDNIAMLLTSGRPNGVDTICVSQHANFTHPLLKDAATHIATFKCTNDRELDMLVGKFPDREAIARLDYEKREFLFVDVASTKCVRSSLSDIVKRVV